VDTTTSSPIPAKVGAAAQPKPAQSVPSKRPADYLWAVLIARIYEVFPLLCPARGPPSRDDCDAQVDDGVQSEPDWDLAALPAPDCEVDQRISW
jgi:hypothetical protein